MVFINETSSNKSYFLRYLPLFWPEGQLRAAVKPNLSLSVTNYIWYSYRYKNMYNNMYISWCVNWVTVFKLLVDSVNITRRQLLYIISLWFSLKKMSTLYCSGVLLAVGLGGLQPSWNLRVIFQPGGEDYAHTFRRYFQKETTEGYTWTYTMENSKKGGRSSWSKSHTNRSRD